MTRISDRNDWFEIWFEDRQGMLACMARNIAADIAAGYDYYGNTVTKARAEMDAYKAQFDREMDNFHTMDEKTVNRWCYYDLKKRGAIA